MRLQQIVYVTDMDRSVAWYSMVLGAAPDATSSHWTTGRSIVVEDPDGTRIQINEHHDDGT